MKFLSFLIVIFVVSMIGFTTINSINWIVNKPTFSVFVGQKQTVALKVTSSGPLSRLSAIAAEN